MLPFIHSSLLPEAPRKAYLISTNGFKWSLGSVKLQGWCNRSNIEIYFWKVACGIILWWFKLSYMTQLTLRDTLPDTIHHNLGAPEDFHIPSETSGGNPVLWFTVRRLSSYSDVGNKEWTPLKKIKSCYGGRSEKGRSPSYALWVSLSCRRKSWHVCKSGFHNDLIMGNCALLSFMRPSFSVQFYCFIFNLYCCKE